MNGKSIGLFLSTLALAGGTAACSHSPEAGEQGGDQVKPELQQPAKPPADTEGGEGGEGGEG